MTLTLQLSTETQANLSAESARTGKRPEDLALEAVEEKFSSVEPIAATLPLDAWQAKFEAMLASMQRGNPETDFTQDRTYEGRGQ